MRLLPLLAGLGGLLLTWRLAHLILSPLGRALAVAFLAVAIWPVSMSTVIKPYSLDLLMSAALLVPAVEWLRRPERVRWLLVLAVVMPVAVFGSYPSVFVAGGVSLALLAQVWHNRAGRPRRPTLWPTSSFSGASPAVISWSGSISWTAPRV